MDEYTMLMLTDERGRLHRPTHRKSMMEQDRIQEEKTYEESELQDSEQERD